MRQVLIKSRITGHPGLVRPMVGGGVINLDDEGYQRALARVRSTQKQKELESKVDHLQQQMDLIIQLLREKAHD